MNNNAPNVAKYLDAYIHIPKDITEYQNAVKSILLDNVNKRMDDYQEQFHSNKDKISKDDYNHFEQEIIDKYGSIENFFNK